MFTEVYSAIKRRRYARKQLAQQRKEVKASSRGRQFKTLTWLAGCQKLNDAQRRELGNLTRKLGVMV